MKWAYQDLEVTHEGAVAWLTPNRPHSLNALNPTIVDELQDFTLMSCKILWAFQPVGTDAHRTVYQRARSPRARFRKSYPTKAAKRPRACLHQR
jgi:1,4-dihydroxy-2-naphthoyl-CoA synthase